MLHNYDDDDDYYYRECQWLAICLAPVKCSCLKSSSQHEWWRRLLGTWCHSWRRNGNSSWRRVASLTWLVPMLSSRSTDCSVFSFHLVSSCTACMCCPYFRSPVICLTRQLGDRRLDNKVTGQHSTVTKIAISKCNANRNPNLNFCRPVVRFLCLHHLLIAPRQQLTDRILCASLQGSKAWYS